MGSMGGSVGSVPIGVIGLVDVVIIQISTTEPHPWVHASPHGTCGPCGSDRSPHTGLPDVELDVLTGADAAITN